MLPQFGKALIVFGVVIVVLGVILLFFDRIPFLGKLPGDISFRSGNTRIYFPIVTCIIISLILTVILNLFRK
jgi:hypothetical protein